MPYNRINAIVGGKEKVVTSVDVYKEIRRLQLEGVTSQRAAAKRLGISRNTVKKYWEGNAVPWDRKEYSRDPAVMTTDVVQFISSCLDEDDCERVKKQRHTARRIYQRLVEECGFTGSESSVRNVVHDMRAARKETKVFVPLKFAPGEAVQIDWGEATVYMNGEKLVINLFCARLCHRDAYQLGRIERQLEKTDLLILDELSYMSFNKYESELLFKVISERSERSSTIVTTNLAFSEWTQLFENTTMVAALVDRLTYRSHVLDMSGPSYRLLTAQAENETATAASTAG